MGVLGAWTALIKVSPRLLHYRGPPPGRVTALYEARTAKAQAPKYWLALKGLRRGIERAQRHAQWRTNENEKTGTQYSEFKRPMEKSATLIGSYSFASGHALRLLSHSHPPRSHFLDDLAAFKILKEAAPMASGGYQRSKNPRHFQTCCLCFPFSAKLSLAG